MPIDPNIIGNVMIPQAPNLPDVNAMMQTQQRGMESTIQMERQREADALSAQDRETDAAAKALAPAIASAFSDPSDEGLDIALSMVPAQYQAVAMAQIDQLRAVPDLNRRKDIIRAGLAQDDYGRAILAQLEPTANMRLQADTAAQAQALRMRELQLQERQFAEKAAQTAPISVQQPPDETAPPPMDPKVKLKLDQAYPQAARALQTSITNLDSDISDVQKLLLDEVGLRAITGYLNANTPAIFEDATRAQALLDKIMSGAGFSALQAMRDASPTGGALGNVSNQEGSKLEKSVAAFSQAQSFDDFREALRQYLIDLKIAQENVQAAFDETYSYRGGAPSAGIVTETQARRERVEQETQLPQTRRSLPPGVTVKRN